MFSVKDFERPREMNGYHRIAEEVDYDKEAKTHKSSKKETTKTIVGIKISGAAVKLMTLLLTAIASVGEAEVVVIKMSGKSNPA